MHQVELRRSKQSRRASLRITADGTVRCTTPYYTPLAEIRRWLSGQEAWLNAHHTRRALVDGQRLSRRWRLRLLPGTQDRQPLELHHARHIVTLTAPADNHAQLIAQLEAAFLPVLRQEATDYLPTRLASLAKRWNFVVPEVRCKRLHSRWGSYSPQAHRINLNIFLLTLPDVLSDHVLLHELCHIEVPKHGVDFWQLLAQLDPKARQHHLALKKHHPSFGQ